MAAGAEVDSGFMTFLDVTDRVKRLIHIDGRHPLMGELEDTESMLQSMPPCSRDKVELQAIFDATEEELRQDQEVENHQLRKKLKRKQKDLEKTVDRESGIRDMLSIAYSDLTTKQESNLTLQEEVLTLREKTVTLQEEKDAIEQEKEEKDAIIDAQCDEIGALRDQLEALKRQMREMNAA